MNKLDIILIIISSILLISNIILFIKFFINNNKIKILMSNIAKLSMNNNYENDIQFLQFIMSEKIERCKTFIVKPIYSLNNKKIINDDEINLIIENLVIEIKDSLNNDYIQTLYKYFNENSLNVYITEVVFSELMSEVINTNAKRIKSFNVQQ